MDKEVEERAQNIKKVTSFLNSKSQELAAAGNTGPLARRNLRSSELKKTRLNKNW